MTSRDGIGGTDGSNVKPLFSDQITAAGLPPQLDVIAALQRLLLAAETGKITSLAIVAFDPHGSFMTGTYGKCSYTGILGGMEDLKFQVLLNQYRITGTPL